MSISSEDFYIEVTIDLSAGINPASFGMYEGLAVMNTQADRGPSVNFFGVIGYNTETKTNVGLTYSIGGVVQGKDIIDRYDVSKALYDTPSREYFPANDWFYWEGKPQYFYNDVYLINPITSDNTFGLGPSSSALFASTRWLGEYQNGKTAYYTKAFYLYKDVKTFFTDENDTVNFNILTPSQLQAIKDGADIYNALDGADTVYLPDTVVEGLP